MKSRRLLLSGGLALALTLATVWLLGRVPRVTQAEGADAYTTYYVAPSCSGVPTPCYTTVQDAVDAADEASDVIRVATGAYTDVSVRPRADITTAGVVTQVVYISKTISIQGGYAPTDWATSYPITQPTTLDAQRQGRVLYVTGDISVSIKGLRATGGDATGLGGGLGGDDAGGGIYIITATAVVSNNWIHSNTHGYGAGLCLHQSDSLLAGNTISNNTTSDGGGGMIAYFGDITLRGNTIRANTASFKGGGLYLYNLEANLESNSFVDNTTDGDGGGLYVWGSRTTLTGNEVISNSATSGGGLFILFNRQTLAGNTVANNTAGAGGGGVLLLASNTYLVNNLIVRNTASTGGAGVYVAASEPHLIHNTIADNTGCDSGVHLSQEWLIDSAATFTNTLLANHTMGIYVDSGSTATLESTLWSGNVSNWNGGGTINHSNDHSGDPGFKDPGRGDYHIGADSAALDSGTDAGITTDIDSELRPVGSGYDIGADEFSYALSVAKYAHLDPVMAGSLLTYTVLITNTGNVTLTATITDHLPAHVAPAGTLTWADVIIPYHGVWTRTALVTVAMGYAGPLTNVVQVLTDESVTGVYTETSISQVVPALGVTKQANTDSVPTGGRLTYTIQVSNTGNITLTGIITDILPSHVTPTGIITWAATAIAPGDTWSQALPVRVELGYSSTITNEVRITTEEGAGGTDSIAIRVFLYKAFLPFLLRDN